MFKLISILCREIGLENYQLSRLWQLDHVPSSPALTFNDMSSRRYSDLIVFSVCQGKRGTLLRRKNEESLSMSFYALRSKISKHKHFIVNHFMRPNPPSKENSDFSFPSIKAYQVKFQIQSKNFVSTIFHAHVLHRIFSRQSFLLSAFVSAPIARRTTHFSSHRRRLRV